MTDHRDLKGLKDLPVPPPREEARTAAIEAASEAFRLAGTTPFAHPQGNLQTPGLMGASAVSKRLKPMRWRLPVALAASVMMLAIAVPVTLHLLRPPHVEISPTAVTAKQTPVVVVSPLSTLAPAACGMSWRVRSRLTGHGEDPSAPQLVAAAPPPPPSAAYNVRTSPTRRAKHGAIGWS